MRPLHCTITASEVRATANRLLCTSLQLRAGPAGLSVTRIADLLLAAAAWTCSLIAAARQLIGFPSRESIRKAIAHCLPQDYRLLEQRINDGLHVHWPRNPRRGHRGYLVAIDLHQRPYYGDRATAGILNGSAKLGTKYFWTFATFVIVEASRRWTLAVAAVDNNRLESTVARLWQYVEPLRVKVRCVLLDRGFYAGPVIRWLQDHHLPFVMPAVKRGSLGRPPKAPTGTARFFAMKQNGQFEHTWKERGKGRQVNVVVRVVRVLAGGKRGSKRGRHRKTLVYVHSELVSGRSCRWLVQTYRKRFGIETSYRQLGEGLASSCSTDRRVRLLLVGVAVLMRNVWVWLQSLPSQRLSSTAETGIRLMDLKVMLNVQIVATYGSDKQDNEQNDNLSANTDL